jgi:hypothetical protein
VHRFLCKFVKQRVLSYRPEPSRGAFLVRCPAIVHTRHRDFVLNLRVRNRSPRTFLLLLPVDPVVAPCDVLAVLAGRPLSGAFSCGQRGTVTTVSKPLRRQPLPNSTAGLPVERRVRCLQPNVSMNPASSKAGSCCPRSRSKIYEEIIQFERMEYVSPPTPRLPNRASPPRTFRTNPPAHSLPLARERATDPRT